MKIQQVTEIGTMKKGFEKVKNKERRSEQKHSGFGLKMVNKQQERGIQIAGALLSGGNKYSVVVTDDKKKKKDKKKVVRILGIGERKRGREREREKEMHNSGIRYEYKGLYDDDKEE